MNVTLNPGFYQVLDPSRLHIKLDVELADDCVFAVKCVGNTALNTVLSKLVELKPEYIHLVAKSCGKKVMVDVELRDPSGEYFFTY